MRRMVGKSPLSRISHLVYNPWRFEQIEAPVMPIVVEATYQIGVLRLDKRLPLVENERVQITVQTGASVADRSYGMIGWTGDAQVLRQIAEDDDELYPSESP